MYQCAAVAGERWAVASAAWVSVASACSSPRCAGPLDVVGQDARRGALRAQCGDGASVGGEPPAGSRGVVHRAPHERVAEREAARVLGRTDEVGGDQCVERRQRVIELRDGGGQVDLERLARDRRTVQQPPRVRVERAELARERLGHAVAAARELQQEERVAGALGDDPLVCDQRPRFVGAEGLQVEPAAGAVAAGTQHCRGQHAGHGPVRDRHQHRRRRRVAQQVADQLDRRRVRPVEIVKRDHRRGQVLEQHPHGSVSLEPLGIERRAEHVVERTALRAEMVVQGIDHGAVGNAGLELRTAPGEHHVRARGELGQHPALAESERAGDRHAGTRAAAAHVGQRLLEHSQLTGAADQHALN